MPDVDTQVTYIQHSPVCSRPQQWSNKQTTPTERPHRLTDDDQEEFLLFLDARRWQQTDSRIDIDIGFLLGLDKQMGGMTESQATPVPLLAKIPAENTNDESSSSDDQDQAHPQNTVDHRPNNGPLLQLLWSEEEPLHGQTLYLGGEFGVDGKIYCIPGHGKSDGTGLGSVE